MNDIALRPYLQLQETPTVMLTFSLLTLVVSGLLTETATMQLHALFRCDFATPPINRWNLPPLPLIWAGFVTRFDK